MSYSQQYPVNLYLNLSNNKEDINDFLFQKVFDSSLCIYWLYPQVCFYRQPTIENNHKAWIPYSFLTIYSIMKDIKQRRVSSFFFFIVVNRASNSLNGESLNITLT